MLSPIIISKLTVKKTKFEYSLKHATSSKTEQINDNQIETIVTNALIDKDKMRLLKAYVGKKLYSPDHKWKKITKLLYLILSLLTRAKGDEEVKAFVLEHTSRITSLKKFKFFISGEDKGGPSKFPFLFFSSTSFRQRNPCRCQAKR